MDDDIDVVECGAKRLELQRRANDGDTRRRDRTFRFDADDRADLVAPRDQAGRGMPSDETGRAGHGNASAHDRAF
jgi:hypothetical protein